MRVGAVLLAAGASRRLGRPKQALEVEGESLLHRAARLAVDAGFDPVVVVLGCGAEACRPVLAGLEVRIVLNPGWEEGMASSIRAGLGALPGGVEGAAFLVCDQPRLDAEHLRKLLGAFLAAQGRPAASAYAGTRGIPAILPRSRFPELMRLRGDQGAKGLLGDAAVVDFPSGELDLDRPEDLLRR